MFLKDTKVIPVWQQSRDNADGERLFILENIQYPVTVSQNGGGSEGPLTRGGLVPDSTSHSNMVPLHHMRFSIW